MSCILSGHTVVQPPLQCRYGVGLSPQKVLSYSLVINSLIFLPPSPRSPQQICFSVSIILPFPECHAYGIRYCLLSIASLIWLNVRSVCTVRKYWYFFPFSLLTALMYLLQFVYSFVVHRPLGLL